MSDSSRDVKAPSFRKALQFRRFQDVVQQIQDAILDGHISNGDMLPSERELKERFCISRGTLREALRVLEDRGLIEIKIGNKGGTFVRKVTTEHASESLAILIRSQVVSLEHLAQFRQSVEGDIAAMAAHKAGPEDLSRLTCIADAAGGLVLEKPGGHKDFYALDQSFHIELARISENPVFVMVMKSVHANILKYYESFLELEPDDLRENILFFYDLIDVLRRKQSNEARILAQNHVVQFGRKMRAMKGRSANAYLDLSSPNIDPQSDKEGACYAEPESHSPQSSQ